MSLNKLILWFCLVISVFCSSIFAYDLSIKNWTSWDTQSSLWSFNMQYINFMWWNNDYLWFILLKNSTELVVAEPIKIWTVTLNCHVRLNWYYYNSMKWNELYPLDETTYNWNSNLTSRITAFDWWLYTNCDWVDEKFIFWQVKITTTTRGTFTLTAWTKVELTTNSMVSWPTKMTN
jgi:hypothetical protein